MRVPRLALLAELYFVNLVTLVRFPDHDDVWTRLVLPPGLMKTREQHRHVIDKMKPNAVLQIPFDLDKTSIQKELITPK